MITVQYRDPGMPEWGTINYLSGDNTEVSAVSSDKREAARFVLLQKATNIVGAWGRIFPETKFRIHEDERI